jgi:hypothetical protein
MDELLAALGIVYFWRVIVSGVAGYLIALIVVNVTSGKPAPVIIALIIIGLFFGLFWQVKAMAGLKLTEPEPPVPPIATPVAFLGLGCAGGVFAGFMAYAVHSWVGAGLIALCAMGFAGLWYTLVDRMTLALRQILLTAGFALGVACGLVAVAWPPICRASACIKHF